MTTGNPYQERYQAPGYYWGTQPSILCSKLLDLIPGPERAGKHVIDLGCGEGRNAVFLAAHGFTVLGIDNAPSGLAKVGQMASENSVKVETLLADITSESLVTELAAKHWGKADVLLSTGTVQYVPPSQRRRWFERLKSLTPVTGLHAISALVAKPFIAEAPDAQPNVTLFRSGELLGYYWDWELLYTVEETFNCISGGTGHRHAVNRIIAARRI